MNDFAPTMRPPRPPVCRIHGRSDLNRDTHALNAGTYIPVHFPKKTSAETALAGTRYAVPVSSKTVSLRTFLMQLLLVFCDFGDPRLLARV
jgi:hypothetical protein